MKTVSWRNLIVWLLGALIMALIAVPIGTLIARGFTHGDLREALGNPLVTSAVQLSLITTVITLAASVALGTPAAYVLARRRFPGCRLVDALVDLPMVLPPVVGGLALLLTLGRRGPVGGALQAAGADVAFTTAAVVLAQIFVSAPFYIRAAKAGFQSVDRRLEAVSATLGASDWRTFRQITLPLALPALASGAIMCWARALGEFGATMMFAGNLTGTTQTMPLAILDSLESDLDAAVGIAIILIAVAAAVLLTFKLLARLGGRPL